MSEELTPPKQPQPIGKIKGFGYIGSSSDLDGSNLSHLHFQVLKAFVLDIIPDGSWTESCRFMT